MPPPARVRFGAFEFDAASGELWRDGERVPLQRQPSRLLDLLLGRPGEVVAREEIRLALWGEDTHVDFERSLNFCVAKLRAALGDSAAQPQFIETVPTRGYRFIAGVDPDVGPGFSRAPAEPAHPRGSAILWTTGAVALAIAAVVALRVFVDIRPGVPKVVVVPFKNETGAAELDRLAKGVSDATVARLADSDRVRVIATRRD